MNQHTAAPNQNVNTGFKAELTEVMEMLKEMGDARNFSQTPGQSGGVEQLANRTVEMQGMFKELRRTLPATYFRNNSRVKRIFDQILQAHETNREELLELHQSGGSSGVASTATFLEKIEKCKRRLSDLISKM